MSMKPWEREIIEYRPRIGLDRDIRASIIKQANKEGNVYEPTTVVDQSVELIGAEFLEKGVSLLSEIHHTRKEIENRHSHRSLFFAYMKAKEEDEDEADRIYEENFKNIQGNTDLDVYPILVEMEEELEEYLEYANQEMFEGEADMNDLSSTREKEEEMLEAILMTESEDLSIQEYPQLSPDHRQMIERMLQDEDSPIRTMEDYMTYWRNEQRRNGSPRVNYDYLQERIMFMTTLSGKLKSFDERYRTINQYLSSELSQYMNDDIRGSLEYLVDYPHFGSMIESIETSHQRHTDEGWEQFVNSKRVTDISFRRYLDKRLSEIRIKKQSLINSFGRSFREYPHDTDGSRGIQDILEEGLVSLNLVWRQIAAEHIGASEQVSDQTTRLVEKLEDKKRNQVMYRYIDLVRSEFDFQNENKQDEVNKFLQRNPLRGMRA